MKHKSLIAFLILVTFLSISYVLGLRLAGQFGAYLAQAYMLIPAFSAVITRVFFDKRKFTDANIRFGNWKHYIRFWIYSLGIAVLYFISYTLLGAGRWDFTGNTFLENLAQQLAATGQDVDLYETLPPGMTPQTMLLIYFIGGLTILNILPGIITGLGEEFGWRGLMFPRLYEIQPWMAIIIGGLIWFIWHLPLALVVPQKLIPSPTEQILLVVPMAIGAICTNIYLAYAYFKTQNILVAALAHIVMNNASASLSYIFVIHSPFKANLGLVLVMVLVVAFLYARGELKVFTKIVS